MLTARSVGTSQYANGKSVHLLNEAVSAGSPLAH